MPDDIYTRRIIQPATPLWERQSEPILPGGINWAAPGDEIGTTEAVEVTNFRSNPEGGLRTRFGQTILRGVGGSINAIYRLGNEQVLSSGGTLSGATINISGFSTDPIFAVYWRGLIYAVNRGKAAKYSLLTHTESIFTPAAPDIASVTLTPTNGGALVIGSTYIYWITYVTEDMEESNPVQINFVPVNPTQIASISVTASLDPAVVGWNLYRSGGTLNNAYKLPNPGSATAPLGFGATYADGGDGATTDTMLLDLGIVLQPDHDPPPLGSGVDGPFFGHLLIWGTAEHPNRLYWSRLDQPYAWPGSATDAADGNWVDCGDTDPILNVTIRPRYALIYKVNQVYRLAGDPDDPNSDIEKVMDGFGLAAQNAITPVGPLDVLEGPAGIFSFNGDSAAWLSEKVDPIFHGFSPDLAGIAVVRALSDNRSTNCIGHRYGRIYFSYLEGDNVTRSTLVYNIQNHRWFKDTRGYTALYDEGAGGDLLGATGNNLYAMEDSGRDVGVPINVAYHSRYHDEGAPENEKTYLDLIVEANTNGANLTVSLFYDNGLRQEVLGTINTTSRQQVTFKVGTVAGTRGRNVAVRVEGDSQDSSVFPVLLYSATIHYRIEARNALVWDTGPTDLGDQRVKQLDMLEFSLECSANVTLTLTSNLPGGSMAQRYTQVLLSTGGTRKTLEVQLPAIVEGRLLQVNLTTTDVTKPFKLYSARARVRPLGWYIDGANGEIFITQEMIPNG